MEIISAEARSFYAVIKDIKSFYANNISITEEDKKKVKELLTVLKYKVQFDILDECLSSEDGFKEVLKEVQAKLDELETERRSIKEQIEHNELISNTRRLIALRRSCDELQKIKLYIENKQFSHYVMEMNQSLESTADLIAACNQVLAVGQVDYSRLFGEGLVKDGEINKDAIDTMFSIILDPKLKADIKEYLVAENDCLNTEKKINDNKRMLELLLIAKKNETTVREYLRARVAFSESHEFDYLNAEESLSKDTLVLASLPTTGLAGLFNSKERKVLEDRIEKNRYIVETHLEKKKEASKLEEILRGLGLGGVVDSLSFVNYEMTMSVEEKIAYYIKSYVKKSTFDIRKIVASIENANEVFEEELEDRRELLEEKRTRLDADTSMLVDYYHDDLVLFFKLLNERKREGFTPKLAAYVLKVLSDAKNLDYHDIIDMCNLEVDVDNLFDIYNKLNKDEADALYQQLAQIEQEERTMFDDVENEKGRKI